MPDLEPVTIVDTKNGPTALDKLVEPTIVNLKQLEKLSGDPPPLNPSLEIVPETPSQDIDAAPKAEDDRARDEHGKFVAKAGEPVPKVEAKPAVKAEPKADEDDETKPPTSVAQFEKRLAKERWKHGETQRRYEAMLERVDKLLAERGDTPVQKPEPAK